MNKEYVQGKPMFTSLNKCKKQYPYLQKNIETDICIIGGGVSGAIAAYYLSDKNIRCIILEKKRVAHLSTSVTTSLLQYELDENISQLKEFMEVENIIKAYRLGLKALNEIDKIAMSYGNNFNYAKRDTLLYTSKLDEIKMMEDEYNYRKHSGFDVEYIEDNYQFGFNIKAGVISKDGGAEIDPYKFTSQLLDISESRHCKIYENTEVVDIISSEDSVEVVTEYDYRVKAKKIIVATGYNTDLFTKRNFATKTTTYNIVTKPIDDLDVWDRRILVRDNNDPYNYLRTTHDNRIIIGGEDENFIPGIFDEKLANKKYDILEARLKSMYKELTNIEIEYKYCGTFASTKDNLGFVGPDKEHKNLWYLLGYGANGILFAILGAMFLEKLYHNHEDEDMKLFKVDRFDN